MAKKSPPTRSRRPGLRDQQRLRTRQGLMEAAMKVIDRDGYLAARIDDIAGELGASRATFYLHFDSKAAVIRELMPSVVEGLAPIIDELTEQEDPSWEDLRRWYDRALGYWKRQRAPMNAVQQAVAVEPSLSEQFVESFRAAVTSLSPWLERTADLGREEAAAKALVLLLELDTVGLYGVIRGVRIVDDAVLDALADSLWAVMHPVPRERPVAS